MARSFGPTLTLVASNKTTPTLLHLVREADFEAFRERLPPLQAAWLAQTAFAARAGNVTLLPSDTERAEALLVTDRDTLPWDYANLPTRLPRGHYQVVREPEPHVARALALGWALGSYRFGRYKKDAPSPSTLVWPSHADRTQVTGLAEAFYLARDLINTPASDLGPTELTAAAKDLAKRHGAEFHAIVGDALLSRNYPMIHAVGRASSSPPALIDFTWGKAKHPKLTLVGKGVCFDTGGLDLKPAAFMKLMKKDMGGAAFVLALAHVVMTRKLPVRLRVLIPAVENSVSGNAMRPLDVLQTRKGITVEVGDTDAEGRLVLADALTEAVSESPALLVDAATLTGAARVALGTGMPAIFSSSLETWQALEQASAQTDDPLWRLPLHKPYRNRIDSNIADLNNIGGDSYAGAITAALFLQEFVGEGVDWVHMDTMGFNLEARPGRPVGGEALGLLAFERLLVERFGGRAEPPTPTPAPAGRKAAKPRAARAPTPAAARSKRRA